MIDMTYRLVARGIPWWLWPRTNQVVNLRLAFIFLPITLVELAAGVLVPQGLALLVEIIVWAVLIGPVVKLVLWLTPVWRYTKRRQGSDDSCGFPSPFWWGSRRRCLRTLSHRAVRGPGKASAKKHPAPAARLGGPVLGQVRDGFHVRKVQTEGFDPLLKRAEEQLGILVHGPFDLAQSGNLSREPSQFGPRLD
jgi:hypothetical protein